MVRLNPPLRQNYSIFMRNFQKIRIKYQIIMYNCQIEPSFVNLNPLLLNKKTCRTLLTATSYFYAVTLDSYATVAWRINSHVLTGKNPCINQAIHVLLMRGLCTLHMRILGHQKKLTSSTVTCIEMKVI